MSIMAKTPSGYKKIGSAYLGERPVDKVFNANGDVVYALQRELTGVPPLLFKGKEQSELLNYRIYGDTVDGNSVGDLVESGEHAGEYKVPVTVEGKNLFDSKLILGSFLAFDGSYIYTDVACISGFINVKPNTTYSLHITGAVIRHMGYYGDEFSFASPMIHDDYTFITPNNCNRIRTVFSNYDDSAIDLTIFPKNTIMLNEGSTALPYEPYHAPVTTPIYLPEPIKMVGDEAEYIDYGEQKQHRVRKNLLPNTATSQTINGVTFTVNEDGSVTCNGIASANTYFNLNENFNSTLYAGMKASFYQSEQQPNVNTFIIRISKANRVSIQDFQMNNQVIKDNGDSLLLAIRIKSGYTCNNLTFYPMIRKADIEDDTYEPYIENTELDITLPALPTLTGTNVLSVDTEVQPSRMDIKGRIKSLT